MNDKYNLEWYKTILEKWKNKSDKLLERIHELMREKNALQSSGQLSANKMATMNKEIERLVEEMQYSDSKL